MSANTILSTAAKREITSDWLGEFPEMVVYRPMWLLKRHGPLLIGVILDRSRSNDVYMPKFHVHNLLSPSPTIFLSLVFPVPDPRQPKLPLQIKVLNHKEEYPSAISFLKETIQSLSLSVLSWPQIVELHSDFIIQRRDYAVAKHCSGIFRDVILLALWCGKSDYANRCRSEAIQLMKSWNPPIDVEAWESQLDIQTNQSRMKVILDLEIAKHKLSHVPAYNIDCLGHADMITEVYKRSWT